MKSRNRSQRNRSSLRYFPFTIAGVRRAHAVHPIAAVQTEYSLFSREAEDDLLQTLRQQGVALVAYSPLGRGFLAGRFRTLDDLAPDDWRRGEPMKTLTTLLVVAVVS